MLVLRTLGDSEVLTCDTREGVIPQIKNILAESNYDLPEIQFKKLDVADYLLENDGITMLVERKNISDFAANYIELKPRMDRMRRLDYDYTALLIEGHYNIIDGYIYLWRGNQLTRSIPHKTLTNFIWSQQARGSYIIYTQDLKDTVNTLIETYWYLPKMGLNPGRKTTTGKEWLLTLMGMGPQKLKELSERYPSIIEALRDIDSWISPKARKLLEGW